MQRLELGATDKTKFLSPCRVTVATQKLKESFGEGGIEQRTGEMELGR